MKEKEKREKQDRQKKNIKKLNSVPALGPFPSIIHKILCNFAERSALLSKVDNESNATCLRRLGAFLNSVNEVRTARTDVGAKDVRASFFY